MTLLLGAIADDFTGATDLAGLLARSGARVSLRIGVPEGPPSETAPYEVIALKIRTMPAADAVAQSESALDWLQAAGAKQFFWKYCSTFDSTPEGNIGPVAEALMARLGAKQTIYCPAFPENGRSIFMGNLFVGQQPLAESPMKDHPLTPMRDSNLMRLLAPQVTGDVGLVDRLCVARGAEAVRAKLTRLADQGIAHVVVDAVADADLEVIAQACQSFKLLTGGSALAMPLPALHISGGEPIEDPWQAPKGEALVLSGSCSDMTQRQVAAYATSAPSYKLDPLALARDGVQPVLDWLMGQSGAPLIYATAAPQNVRAAQDQLGRDRAGELVEEALAQIAVFARDKGVRRIVVAGGESSGAVTQALGVTRLDIGPEIAPGVPWCACDSDGKRMALALKSGNFGAEAFFATALQKLDSL
ncbi:3-oxo-tetronate kinase [Yoonia sp.]|uniref:3-oxo-tetronate kinase n=1 Tax=Yoonia sp. TaxID=2212373 RepID=UPI0025F19AFC|nr:3-oxo-tetronate kinase [Yoonia sp.]